MEWSLASRSLIGAPVCFTNLAPDVCARAANWAIFVLRDCLLHMGMTQTSGCVFAFAITLTASTSVSRFALAKLQLALRNESGCRLAPAHAAAAQFARTVVWCSSSAERWPQH